MTGEGIAGGDGRGGGIAGAVAAVTGARVAAARRVGGGDISAAYRVELADGRTVFAKTLGDPPPGFFAAEANGLALLRGTRTAPVPAVLGWDEGLIVLEWLEPAPATAAAADRLGRELAALHDTPAAAYGTPWPAYIGSLPLPSPAGPVDWPAFYAEYRLLPYLRRAVDRGGLAPGDARDVERLCGRIAEVAGPPQPPAVIHGDLWSGNVHWSADGAHLVDPAAQGGHPETDLAFLELFGSPFLARILSAYDEVRPLPGRRARVPLHQLHHLLVHAALFGSSYGARCGAAARAALHGG
ncbi:fructosamine kinase family protein [Streptomyces sp. NPDC051940]|uniref:fructosamine kinase family protein n=1 Tax=Streptomyces sp. NPDC051940 TaxID=3155675 RepID=UPI00342C0A16